MQHRIRTPFPFMSYLHIEGQPVHRSWCYESAILILDKALNVESWLCRQVYGLFRLFHPEKAIVSSCPIVCSGNGLVATAMALHQAEGQSATTSGGIYSGCGHIYWVYNE